MVTVWGSVASENCKIGLPCVLQSGLASLENVTIHQRPFLTVNEYFSLFACLQNHKIHLQGQG